MPRLEVLAYPDESLEVRGAILAGGEEDSGEWPGEEGPDGGATGAASHRGIGLGVLEPTRTRESQNTQLSGLRFRALLVEDGDRRLQLYGV